MYEVCFKSKATGCAEWERDKGFVLSSNYLGHSWEDKGIHASHKGIGSKVNVTYIYIYIYIYIYSET